MNDSHPLSDPLYWTIGENVRQDHIASMGHWAGELFRGDIIQDLNDPYDGLRATSRFIRAGLKILRKRGRPIIGIAVDCGSGVGAGATVVSQLPEFDKVYAVEYSKEHVEQIIPLVFAEFGADVRKIQRVVGDFNHLKFDNESIDLIIDVMSFHHAEDLDCLLTEVFRVLKPGGGIIMIERAHFDTRADIFLQASLDRQLTTQQKEMGSRWKRAVLGGIGESMNIVLVTGRKHSKKPVCQWN